MISSYRGPIILLILKPEWHALSCEPCPPGFSVFPVFCLCFFFLFPGFPGFHVFRFSGFRCPIGLCRFCWFCGLQEMGLAVLRCLRNCELQSPITGFYGYGVRGHLGRKGNGVLLNRSLSSEKAYRVFNRSRRQGLRSLQVKLFILSIEQRIRK